MAISFTTGRDLPPRLDGYEDGDVGTPSAAAGMTIDLPGATVTVYPKGNEYPYQVYPWDGRAYERQQEYPGEEFAPSTFPEWEAQARGAAADVEDAATAAAAEAQGRLMAGRFSFLGAIVGAVAGGALFGKWGLILGGVGGALLGPVGKSNVQPAPDTGAPAAPFWDSSAGGWRLRGYGGPVRRLMTRR